ncbi:MAG: LacI family DNA-binding transcriptional regulator [Alphaproteobacteria bacterium]|nr:LacI family DNA-binding transcriptional regulator [Alphaproteobacteria bacterium]
MAERATVADVAIKAGVSVATVDRVLNRRRPVRRETADAVLQAAEALHYYATPLMRRRAAHLGRPVTFGFVLQKRAKPFYRALADALEAETAAASAIRGAARIRFVDELSPRALVRHMRELEDEVDALAVVAIDHPHISDEIERLRAGGTPTLSLLSHLSAPLACGHVGVDGRKAGRTAAWAIERCAKRRGPVGVLIGSHRYLGHEDREIGFRSYFRERGLGFDIKESIAYLDDETGAHGTLLELLGGGAKPVALYVIGGGVEGVLRALEEEQVSKDVALVCHELNAETRNALIDGTIDMIIDTSIVQVAKRAIEALIEAVDKADTPLGVRLVPFDIYVSENV